MLSCLFPILTYHPHSHSVNGSKGCSKDESILENSGDSFTSSKHSDSSGDFSQLCDFVAEKLQMKSPVTPTASEESRPDDVFQRLLKQIPLQESQLPPPPQLYPSTQADVNQLTSLLRKRIMPPPLTLNPSIINSGYADGYAAVMSPYNNPYYPMTPNAVVRRALNAGHQLPSPRGAPGSIHPSHLYSNNYRNYPSSPVPPVSSYGYQGSELVPGDFQDRGNDFMLGNLYLIFLYGRTLNCRKGLPYLGTPPLQPSRNVVGP
jgi:hypothetical protein